MTDPRTIARLREALRQIESLPRHSREDAAENQDMMQSIARTALNGDGGLGMIRCGDSPVVVTDAILMGGAMKAAVVGAGYAGIHDATLLFGTAASARRMAKNRGVGGFWRVKRGTQVVRPPR